MGTVYFNLPEFFQNTSPVSSQRGNVSEKPRIYFCDTQSIGQPSECLSSFNMNHPVEYALIHVPLVSLQVKCREYAFQASKTICLDDERKILAAQSPEEAKKLGLTVQLRPDWEDVKLAVMYRLCVQQALSDTVIRQFLKDSADSELICGDLYKNTYWSSIDNGQNMLGKVWMSIRNLMKGIV